MRAIKTKPKPERRERFKSKLNSLKSRCELITITANEALNLTEMPRDWSPTLEIQKYLNIMIETCHDLRQIEREKD